MKMKWLEKIIDGIVEEKVNKRLVTKITGNETIEDFCAKVLRSEIIDKLYEDKFRDLIIKTIERSFNFNVHEEIESQLSPRVDSIKEYQDRCKQEIENGIQDYRYWINSMKNNEKFIDEVVDRINKKQVK